MKRGNKVLILCAVLLLSISIVPSLLADHVSADKPTKAEVIQKTKKLHMPFIANDGQMDEQVKFYANTFGGTVLVTKDGEIVYSLPGRDEVQDVGVGCRGSGAGKTGYGPRVIGNVIQSKSEILDLFLILCSDSISKIISPDTDNAIPQSKIRNPESVIRRLALKEELVGAKINEIEGEGISVTKVNYFKGNDPSKWKSNIPAYDLVNLGEVYKGIGLRLKAYRNNVEKLFCVQPGANPGQIKIRLDDIQPPESPFAKGDLRNSPLIKGARGLSINEHGELVVETELGPVKFTKPIAYQEIDGKRVEVECEYVISDGRIQETGDERQGSGDRILKSEARSQHTKSLSANQKPETQNSKPQSPQSEIQNLSSTSIGDPKSEYGFKVAAYDKTKELIVDPLLASTFLGGMEQDSFAGTAIAIDSWGDVYITGYTWSADFPTTAGGYDTSYNGGKSEWSADVFVSKLDSGLTKLLASTFLGGDHSGEELGSGKTIALDTEGNVYVTGGTWSGGKMDFPTTVGAYDTTFNGGDSDVFISKLDSGLTSLLASTFLGGEYSEDGNAIAIGTAGNVYVTGYTFSSDDFPTTVGAYDTTFAVPDDPWFGADAFVSKLDSGLTSLLASTFLRGKDRDEGSDLALDTAGNVYVAGYTYSSDDFPTTVGAYDTSYNGDPYYYNVFVSKMDSELTSLLASTFLGGSLWDRVAAIAINTEGNVYVTGQTSSKDFPTTAEAYDISYEGTFVSRLNSALTSLLASTFMGKVSHVEGGAIAIDNEGNVYVTGNTASSDFPTTVGAYDTTFNGGYCDVFVSKLDSDLSPSVEVTLTMETSSDEIQHKKTVDISGTVALTPNDKGTQNKFLKKKIKLFRISPNGSYEEIKTTKPFKSGSILKYKFKDVRLPDVGRWQVYSFYDGGDGFRGTTSETLEIDVQEEQKRVVGYAILIEGYIEDSSNIDAYNLTTNDIYKKLLDMGFIGDNIYYFNFDDTQEGVDEIPDKGKILDTIANWAKKKMNKKAAPLYIIFAGPGEKETLFIGSEILTANDLSKSLTTLEAGLNPKASKKGIVVILGANRSGSFIDSLSKPGTNRIIITSTDSEEVAYQGPLAPNGTIRHGDYFVYEFFRYGAMGMNVTSCYEKAADTIAVFTNNKNGNGLDGAWAGNGNYFDHAAQHPLMDDNGDRRGTSRVSFVYNGDDGERSEKLIIGKGETPSLEFTRVTDIVSLAAGDTTPELLAEISDAGEGNKAWVEVVPPQYGLENDKESREQQVVDVSRYNSTGFDEESKRYTWNSFTSADFKEPGAYGIFYFAQDAETGDITPIIASDVYKEKDDSDLQGQYLLNFPKDSGTTSVALTFDWTSDGKDPNVTYSLTISESPTFDTVYYQQKGITENNVFVDLSASLLNGTTYYWRVLASDDEGRTKFIERFEEGEDKGITIKGVSSVSGEGNKKNGFTSEAGSFYLIPKIEGYVSDKLTGEKIEGAEVIVQKKNGSWKTDPPLETKKKGYYESFLPSSGKYTISASISGYKKGEKIINANSGRKKLVNMEMESQ